MSFANASGCRIASKSIVSDTDLIELLEIYVGFFALGGCALGRIEPTIRVYGASRNTTESSQHLLA